MIDFHSHILPGIDDGASDVKMSLDMLAKSYEQGVKTVVATPHCYLTKDEKIEHFLEKRQKSFNILIDAMKNDERAFPEVILGCELGVYREPSDVKELQKLCIENTDYILVEMPYEKWNVNNYDFIYLLKINGMKPIIAHIERYWVQRNDFYNLFSLDVLFQVNADFFLTPNSRKKVIPYLFENNALHILGSDMHNTTTRSSNMKQASEYISLKYGNDRFGYLMNNAYEVLNNNDVKKFRFPPLGFFEKIKL